MKHYIILIIVLMIFNNTFSQENSFITTWDTRNHGTSDSFSITIPIYPEYDYNYDVDWDNDGIYEQTNISGSVTHTFKSPGIYTIRIIGRFPTIYFNSNGDRKKLISVEQWGDIQWSSFHSSFAGCENLNINSLDQPNLTAVSDLSLMFLGATNLNSNLDSWNTSNIVYMSYVFAGAITFNKPLNSWDVSNVVDMSGLFYNTKSFNQDLSDWDVSNVSNMQYMFTGAENFNQNIKSWNVSRVSNMDGMFQGAKEFNQDISQWNTSNVINMTGMFGSANSFNQDLSDWDVSNVQKMGWMFSQNKIFNQDIGSWDVSKVENMDGMFNGASAFNQSIKAWNVSNVSNMQSMFLDAIKFNQDISEWDVSNVTDMSYLFNRARNFNQDLGKWNIGKVEKMNSMLNDSGIDIDNYDKTLKGWDSAGFTSKVLDAEGLFYCNSSSSRDRLISKGWIIKGDQNSCLDIKPFIITIKTDNPGTTNNNYFSISTFHNLHYNYNIDWNNDGEFDDTNVTGNISHNFGSPGEYTIRISGVFPAMRNTTEVRKIISIDQWGEIEWHSLTDAFSGANFLNIKAKDAPNLSKVTSLSGMFKDCQEINTDINHWDVSTITNMSNMFTGALSFNQPLDNWDVSNVTTMSYMFYGASSFNQNIENWDVSNVINFEGMFGSALKFNKKIGKWNVSNAKNMSRMFLGDFHGMNFNQNLSEWDVSNVEDMQYMFGSCDNFNQDISKWDVSNVKNMRGMFSGAHKFNQDISNWNVSNVTDMSSMFSTAFLFNQNIGKWDVSSVRNMASMFWVANSFDQSLDVWNVSKVEDMSFMFFNTKMFNGNIGKWDVSNVTNMESMFHGAQSFNQHLGHWNISKVENMRIMLENTGMFTSTYDKTLILWNAQGFKNKRLGAKGLVYCTSKEARDNLIKNGWRFEGDIFICPPVSRCSGSLSIKLLGYENVDISGGNPPYDTIFTSTEYYHNVTVVDSFGCYASDKLILNQRTFNKPSDMKIFPNPARSYININLDGTFDIELFDQLGRIIVRESNSNQIDVNKINSGIYYLKVNKFNHNTISEQVIIPIVISP